MIREIKHTREMSRGRGKERDIAWNKSFMMLLPRNTLSHAFERADSKSMMPPVGSSLCFIKSLILYR
jgi:hypothetical protein